MFWRIIIYKNECPVDSGNAEIITNKAIMGSIEEENGIIHLINNLDSEVKSGFTLYRNSNPTGEWRDLEIFRLYDWGQIHLTWCTDRKNESVEKSIKIP